MATRRDDRQPHRPRELRLADMPEHLRWTETAALDAERRQWLTDHGFSGLDYVRTLLPTGGNR